MENLYEKFLTARRYLKNITRRTEYSYRNAERALFHLYGKDFPVEDLSKGRLSEWVIAMRQAGLSPASCNVYIRTVNAFLRWLQEERYTGELFKIPLQKGEHKVIATFSAGRPVVQCIGRPSKTRAKLLV